MTNFSDILKGLRKKAGMTQFELAKRLNISASAIGMYEQGRRLPDSKMLLAVSAIFDVTVDYLLGREEYKKTPSKDGAISTPKQHGILANNLHYYMDLLDFTAKDLALRTGIASHVIEQYLYGTSSPSDSDLNALASAFMVKKADLTEIPADRDDGLSYVLTLFSHLSPESRNQALEYMAYLAHKEHKDTE